MIEFYIHYFVNSVLIIFFILGITQTLEMTEQSRELLEKEISALNHDRAELTEQVNMVSYKCLLCDLYMFVAFYSAV